jgi:hypothetical protein
MASAWLEKPAKSKVVEIPVAMPNDFRNFVVNILVQTKKSVLMHL